MLSRLTARNFKSVGNNEIDLELKPLTILVGPNAAGKSNILESLLVLAQATDIPDSYIKSLSGSISVGKYITYGRNELEALVHKSELTRKIVIKISVKPSVTDWQKLPDSLLQFEPLETVGYSYEFTPKDQVWNHSVFINDKLLIAIGKVLVSPNAYRTELKYPEIYQHVAVSTNENILDPKAFDIQVSAFREGLSESLIHEAITTSRIAQEIVSICGSTLKKVHYLSPLRGSLAQSRVPSSPSNTREPFYGIETVGVGKNGEYLLDVLAIIFGQRKYEPISQKIEFWARRFGLEGIRAGLRLADERRNVTQIGSDYSDPYLKSNIETYLASHGSKQILSIITQLFWSENGDTILIEEPEISLHPKSQVDLQHIFAEAVREGKQIICTTHSAFLILSLSKVIKEKLMSSDDIAVYHIQRGDDGATTAKRLSLDKEGYISGWIPSYIEVEEELFKEWEQTLGEK